MKATPWAWLAVLFIPGCILVQPLDEAKPADDGSAGSNNSAGKSSQAGSAGRNSAGASAGGSGNRAGAGPGGAPNGGAPGVDFSFFTGTWTVTGGKITTQCEGGNPMTEDATTGGTDTVAVGTTSDLVFGPGLDCEILADVDDRTAYLNPKTQPCSYSDATADYDMTYDSFSFVVSGNGLTAKANISTSVLATDTNDNLYSCEVTQVLDYKR